MFNKFLATLAIIAVSHVAEGIKWRQAYRDASSSLADGEEWNNRQAFRAGLTHDESADRVAKWRKAMKEAQSGMEEGEEWTDRQAFRAGLRFAR